MNEKKEETRPKENDDIIYTASGASGENASGVQNKIIM